MKQGKLFKLLAIVMLFIISSCNNTSNKPENNLAIENNKETMKKVFNAFDTGNTDSLDHWISENFIDHSPDPNIKTTGIQGLKDMIKMYHEAFPEMKQNIMSMWADNDMVIAHFNMKGTNSGAMGPMPATNKSMDVNGVDIVRFENGKAVEHWGYFEEGKMMQQLGLMGDMNQPADASKMTMDDKMKMEKKK